MAGRKTVMTKDRIKKIEEALIVGGSVKEAAIYAGISHTTIYDHMKADLEFSDRVKQLQGMTSLKAKINIDKAITKGDIPASKWHLERTEDDYNPKQKQEVDVKITPYEQLIKKLSGDAGEEGK